MTRRNGIHPFERFICWKWSPLIIYLGLLSVCAFSIWYHLQKVN